MSWATHRESLRLCLMRSLGTGLGGCLGFALMAAVTGFGQTRTNSFEVSGVVLDPSGAVIAEARVVLRRMDGRSEETRTTNQRGEFRFTGVATGDYEVEAQKEGFKPLLTRLVVGVRAAVPIRIALTIAELREEMNVADQPGPGSTRPDENLDVVKLDKDTLNKLPVLGSDVIGGLTKLMDAGSIGSSGPTVIVDGLETTKKVRASKIQEVRINQNPYSAEFSRPGRGRIEVITKAGSPQYHGELDFIFRDHRLEARNAFALERPPEQRRIFEGNLTGPILNRKRTSFLFAVNREEEDLQAIVFARTPAGVVAENVANPSRDTELSLRIDHQPSNKTTLSVRYEFTFDSTGNGGVGGFNLPEVATNSTGREHEMYFTHRRVISAHLVNEFMMRVGVDKGSTRGVRPGPRIVVLDAFTGGGSQVDRRSTETLIQLNEIVSWNHGKHFVRSGLNIPGITRRGLSDRTNFGGTFSFATLSDFLNNLPFLFSINQGNGRVAFWQRDFGLFAQDDILVRPSFSIGIGLRYDRQNHLGDNNNFGPRLSFAFAPDKERKTVLRGGLGVFYDRTGSGPIADTLRFDGRSLRQITISDPGFPDPFSSGGSLAARPSNIVRFARDIRSPYTHQFSLGVERRLTRSLTATASYINTRGIKVFRSRDANAPSPPSFLDRPDPTIGVLRQIESSAHSQAHALELMLRGKLSRFFNGTIQYNLGRAYNNSGGINSLPADNNDLTREWARADFDERHRFNLLGVIEASDWFSLGMTLSLTSGRPYSLTTGRDDNRDSVPSDRPPAVRRNSLHGPGAATLDLRWSKEFLLKETKKEEGPTFTIGIDAFNVLNRTNYTGFVGNLSSPFFGLAVAARPARRMQLSLGFEF